MQIKVWIGKSVDENVWRIANDRTLQCFMAGAFSLLLIVLIAGSAIGNFGTADSCYQLVRSFFDRRDISTLPNILFLIPPYLFSPDQNAFRYLFSLYGFAFYMLGGHFVLKSCRRTGYSEKDAYVLLFIIFLCSLQSMLQSTGPVAASLTILSLWFFGERSYRISFTLLALATVSGIYPALLFVIFLILSRDSGSSRDRSLGTMIYLVICAVFVLMPHFGMIRSDLLLIDEDSPYLSVIYDRLNIAIDGPASVVAGLLVGMITFAATFRRTRPENTIRDAACLLWTALVPCLLLSTVHTASFFVWITMLFPMTQMRKTRSMYIPPAYGMFALFCILSGVCLFIAADSEFYDAAVFSRAFSLTALWILTVLDYIDKKRARGPKMFAGATAPVKGLSRRYPARAWHRQLSRILRCWLRP